MKDILLTNWYIFTGNNVYIPVKGKINEKKTRWTYFEHQHVHRVRLKTRTERVEDCSPFQTKFPFGES